LFFEVKGSLGHWRMRGGKKVKENWEKTFYVHTHIKKIHQVFLRVECR
jgi:hypothetical protein